MQLDSIYTMTNHVINIAKLMGLSSILTHPILVNPYSRVGTGLKIYLDLEGFLEKSLKIKSALKSTGKSLKSLEKLVNSTIFCRT